MYYTNLFGDIHLGSGLFVRLTRWIPEEISGEKTANGFIVQRVTRTCCIEVRDECIETNNDYWEAWKVSNGVVCLTTAKPSPEAKFFLKWVFQDTVPDHERFDDEWSQDNQEGFTAEEEDQQYLSRIFSRHNIIKSYRRRRFSKGKTCMLSQVYWIDENSENYDTINESWEVGPLSGELRYCEGDKYCPNVNAVFAQTPLIHEFDLTTDEKLIDLLNIDLTKYGNTPITQQEKNNLLAT